MPNLRHFLHDFYFDDKGAAAVEYALLISGIAAVVATSIFLVGGTVQKFYQDAVAIFPK